MTEAPRVVLDVRGAQPLARVHRGGIHRYCTRLTETLLTLPSPPELDLLVRSDRPLADATAPFMASGRVHSPSSVARVADEARAAGRPLVHHLASPFELELTRAEVVPFAMAGAALVATLHDVIPLEDGQPIDTAWRVVWRARAELLRRAELVICISESTAEHGVLRLGIDERRIRVIGHGAPAPGPSLPPPRHEGVERPYVLYTGGASDPRKNVVALVEAFGLLPPALRSSHRLVVASDLPDYRRHELMAAAAERGIEDRVRLLGWVEDDELTALYQHARAFAYPSRFEGFGLAIAEAMAHGVPVVASGTGACAELHGHPRGSFDPDDPADIARVLGRVLDDEDLHDDLRAWSLARAAALSWTECARRTAAVYEEAAHSNGVGRARTAAPVVFATWDSPDSTSAAGRALALGAASGSAARVALPSPLRARQIGAVVGPVDQLARESGHVVCIVQDAVALRAALTVLRRRPGIAVLWNLDAMLPSLETLAAVVAAAATVVVRDAMDAWRLQAALGRGARAELLAPPVAPWQAHGPRAAPSCDLLVAMAPARDGVRMARPLATLTALLPSADEAAESALRRVIHVAAALACSGEAVRVMALGGPDRDGRRRALPASVDIRRLRLQAIPRPGTQELLDVLTASDVVLIPLGTPRSAAEDDVDLALGAGRPVIAPGPPGADGPGTVRLPPAAELSAVLASVHDGLARRDAPSIPLPPGRRAPAVADALLRLVRQAME